MADLPIAFTDYTRRLMGEERFGRYLQAFGEVPPVSLRLNPLKADGLAVADGEQVPWCKNGYYLPQRPNFTFDPLLHAGCYYVQEAASMFLDAALRQHLFPDTNGTALNTAGNAAPAASTAPMTALDLCAAPGGKSTLLRPLLPAGSVLYANEPKRQRASILAENLQKWGWADCIVTNNYPRDFRAARMSFDVILCDVPCSGEGMFRKDPATIGEWSPQQVERCWPLQREIVSDAWACLRDGGLLIYSTCTFNTKENEENVRWLLEEHDASALRVDTDPAWHITGSLLDGFDEPVYRFIPGLTRSEGLFLCVLRKGRQAADARSTAAVPSIDTKGAKGGRRQAKAVQGALNVMPDLTPDGTPVATVGLSYRQAMDYLRHEALVLPASTPRGLVQVTFMEKPLGLVKNIGSRANNLYPKEWKIKTTHIPTDYEAILRHP